MEFLKYQHIERFDTDEVMGIDQGLCYLFPKIDGTNGQLWWNNGLMAGSRNRQLTLDNDNAGFYNWAVEQSNLNEFFKNNQDIRLYGEWLVPHALKTYEERAWKNFYVFDVMKNDMYMSYDDYKILLDEYSIEYIPALCKIENPRYDYLIKILDKNNYLIQDGKGTGEGIVIKNYSYKNKFGRITWAKIVKNEFKSLHQKVWDTTEIKQKEIIEEKIVDKYITKSLIEKEFFKIKEETGWSSKNIHRLLDTVFYCLINEEIWNILKSFKNPVIDFSKLKGLTTNKIKKEMPNIF